MNSVAALAVNLAAVHKSFLTRLVILGRKPV